MSSEGKKQVELKFVHDEDCKFNIILRTKDKEKKLKTSRNDIIKSSTMKSHKKAPREKSIPDDDTDTYRNETRNKIPLESNRKSPCLSGADSSQITSTSSKKKRKNIIEKAVHYKTDTSSLNTLSPQTLNNQKTPTSSKRSLGGSRITQTPGNQKTPSSSKCSNLRTRVTQIPGNQKTPTSSKRSVGKPLKTSTRLTLSEEPTGLSSAINTPKSCLRNFRCEQTPSAVRKKLRFGLNRIQYKKELDDLADLSDYSVSSDEYVPRSESDDSITDEEEQVGSEEDFDTETSTFYDTPKRKKLTPILEKTVKNKFLKHLENDTEYIINADDYFVSKSSKGPTSNNKLSKIDIPHLKEDDLKNILLRNYIKHPVEAEELFRHYETLFHLWLFYLKEGFNLLMYGLGSKIDVLNNFQKTMLSEHFVCTLHGYFPDLTLKNVLSSLVIDILKQKKCPTNINKALSLIESLLKKQKPIFLIIHNIDGIAFRRNKCHHILSKLASFKNLHLIATIDHINAPLMWGALILNRFKFLYLNVTTYRPHLNETSFKDSLHLAQSDNDMVSLSSLKEIFKPLPQKTKKIFQIIAKDYLENKRSKLYKGFSFDEWYARSKRLFLTNGKTAFRVQITELIDHNIIKKNSDDIQLKIEPDILLTFYAQQFPDG